MRQVKMDLNDELRNFEQKAKSCKNSENSIRHARYYLWQVEESGALYSAESIPNLH